MKEKNAQRVALAKIASVIPVVPFKGVDAFFDIGGLLAHPSELELGVELLVQAIINTVNIDEIDAIGCFDARGFLFGPTLGMRFQKKVFMLRKPDKMPNVSNTIEYFKEYTGDNTITGGDQLSIQRGVVNPGDRVLLVDDLLATGGTVEAGIRLVEQVGGKVRLCVFMLEIAALKGRDRALHAVTNSSIDIIALLSEHDF